MSIFVSIASYRDPLLWLTVHSIYSRAANASEIHIGIVDQNIEPFDFSDLELPLHNISYLFVDWRDTKGLGWARTLAMSMFDSQDWFLQIDAHTQFEQDWDIKLVEGQAEISRVNGNERTLLSSHPAPFRILSNGEISLVRGERAVHAHVLAHGEKFNDNHCRLQYCAWVIDNSPPILGCHLAGGFIFAPELFVYEVPYDPWLYFSEEEQALSIRAFTCGWDIIHPPDAPVFHLYNNEDRANLPGMLHSTHWQDCHKEGHLDLCLDLDSRSKKRLADLLCHGKSMGAYGLGSRRSIEEFAVFSGVDYKALRINPAAYAGHWKLALA